MCLLRPLTHISQTPSLTHCSLSYIFSPCRSFSTSRVRLSSSSPCPSCISAFNGLESRYSLHLHALEAALSGLPAHVQVDVDATVSEARDRVKKVELLVEYRGILKSSIEVCSVRMDAGGVLESLGKSLLEVELELCEAAQVMNRMARVGCVLAALEKKAGLV